MALTFDQLSSLTTNHFLPQVVDNVYDSKAFIKRLVRPEAIRLKSGGIKIQGPIYYSAPGVSGRYFSGYDTLDSTPTDDITSFTQEWKQIQEPVRISMKELNQNKGDEQKISLLVSKSKLAQLNLTENLGLGLFSDGTAATGALTTKQITGTAAILSTSSTYGTIAVADVPTWVGVVKENSSVVRNLSLNLMQQTWGACSIDSSMPTVLVSRQNVYDQYWAMLQPHQRLVSESMKNLGFEGVIMFNSAPFIVDSHVPAGEIQFLNEGHVYLCVHKDDNMKVTSFDKIETFHGILNRITWMGNLVCDARRLQGVLKDIAVA
jgi:hypothetical protein